jgi:hypothetical protein
MSSEVQQSYARVYPLKLQSPIPTFVLNILFDLEMFFKLLVTSRTCQVSKGIALEKEYDYDGAVAVYRKAIHADPQVSALRAFCAYVGGARCHTSENGVMIVKTVWVGGGGGGGGP